MEHSQIPNNFSIGTAENTYVDLVEESFIADEVIPVFISHQLLKRVSIGCGFRNPFGYVTAPNSQV
jgi:hypothetical protein